MPRPVLHFLLAPLFASLVAIGSTTVGIAATDDKPTLSGEELTDLLIQLSTERNLKRAQRLINRLEKNWSDGMIAYILESRTFTRSDEVRSIMLGLVHQAVTDRSVRNTDDIYQWLWNQKIVPLEGYANFKAAMHSLIDARFDRYFRDREASARIRLDEIRWGGVLQDGIPPLRNPEMIRANEADYLEDDNIVFGIEINGDARAYPKRILAWHEMFTDTIGDVPITGVYCTLCGTVIPYRSVHNGQHYVLGTSGFLYRSNKLMYDRETQSLWSTTRGVPVLGPLVDQGIELAFESVVTTTWGEWRKRHPNTTVLSLNTGHRRDYGEGVAYNDYFSNDRLMFNTPFSDDRLDNKQEVLALRFPAAPNQQIAIDTAFLNRNPVYHNRIGLQKFVVVTDGTGANRVYDPKEVEFTDYDGEYTLTDKQGQQWLVSESWLQNKEGQRLHRLPYRRAFWFGWHAAFPETQLIK